MVTYLEVKAVGDKVLLGCCLKLPLANSDQALKHMWENIVDLMVFVVRVVLLWRSWLRMLLKVKLHLNVKMVPFQRLLRTNVDRILEVALKGTKWVKSKHNESMAHKMSQNKQSLINWVKSHKLSQKQTQWVKGTQNESKQTESNKLSKITQTESKAQKMSERNTNWVKSTDSEDFFDCYMPFCFIPLILVYNQL